MSRLNHRQDKAPTKKKGEGVLSPNLVLWRKSKKDRFVKIRFFPEQTDPGGARNCVEGMKKVV